MAVDREPSPYVSISMARTQAEALERYLAGADRLSRRLQLALKRIRRGLAENGGS